jgi:glucan phosphoethanolaminetransferase (alkaline phosphatase superfamily)
MQRHVKMLAFAFFAFGAFWALLAVWMILLAVRLREWDPLTFALISLFTVAATPLLITGWALLRLKRWARPFAIVLAVLALPIFPIGTAFGIYALWVVYSDDAKTLFNLKQLDGEPDTARWRL